MERSPITQMHARMAGTRTRTYGCTHGRHATHTHTRTRTRTRTRTAGAHAPMYGRHVHADGTHARHALHILHARHAQHAHTTGAHMRLHAAWRGTHRTSPHQCHSPHFHSVPRCAAPHSWHARTARMHAADVWMVVVKWVPCACPPLALTHFEVGWPHGLIL